MTSLGEAGIAGAATEAVTAVGSGGLVAAFGEMGVAADGRHGRSDCAGRRRIVHSNCS